MKNNRFFALVIGVLLVVSFSFAAMSRQVINFQGYLTDKNGQPVFGTRTMRFGFYSDTGALLASATDRTVTVYNGNYSTKIELTDTDLAALALNPNGQAWLEVTVNNVTMVPRVQLVSVPYAANVRGIQMNSLNQITAATINASGQVTNNGIIRNVGTIWGGTIRDFTNSGTITNTGTITGGTISNATISGGTYSGGTIAGITGTLSGAALPTAWSGWQEGLTFTNASTAIIRLTGPTDPTKRMFMGLHSNGTIYFGAQKSDETGVNYFATIDANGVHSAAWNDLAEVRLLAKSVKKVPGKVYVMTEDGLKLSSKRCEIGTAGICSDTFGFSLGGKNIDKEKACPVAISGWVLAYVDKKYPIGTALTSGPNGVLTAMSKQEKRDYPERMVGILDMKPEKYNNIKVDGRYWIKVK